jgi:uncharacterized protein YbaR (Trm112 family)
MQSNKHESVMMKILGYLGLTKLRWSVRRLHVPCSSNDLVLEVGAGGNIYPRANVLLDAEEDSKERLEATLIKDRPLVLGLCERLPFKSNSFDFVIASHVLEHTDEPEMFLTELMRVGKAGYIETPEGWFEKMCAFTYHRLECSDLNGCLTIEKKKEWKSGILSDVWDLKLSKSKSLAKFLRKNPDLNHMRYYWEGDINYDVINSEVDASWEYPPEVDDVKLQKTIINSLLSKFRDYYLNARRWVFSQGSRNSRLDIVELLMCPDCNGDIIKTHTLVCENCKRSYRFENGIPEMFPKSMHGFDRR